MSDVLSKYIRDDFQKVLSQYFKPALEYTKSALSSYEYKVYQVSEGECVFLIEDVFALYVGIVDFTFTIRAPKYTVLFEELLFNPFPNLKHTLLRKELYSFLKVGEFDLTVQSSFHFAPFRGFWNSTVKETPEFAVYSIGKENINYSNLKIQSRKQHVEESLPELHLRARFDSWEGYHYLFVVYELEYNGQVGHAVFCVRDKKNLKIHNEARKKVADLEWSAIETLANRNRGKTSSIISVKQENLVQLPKEGLLFDDLMIDAIIESRQSDSATVGKDYFKLSNVLKYYYIHGYVKDEFENKRDELLANYFRNDVGNLIRKQQEILKQAIANEYADEQRYTFLVSGNKWKSEQLVLELTRKLYPQYTVISQHRPYFLKSEKGQMSYDVYILELKVAIEYQGEQHFKPVDIFGGEQHFVEQQKRDRLKNLLSEKNNIKLIYVNYWEDISEDLIRQKINDLKK